MSPLDIRLGRLSWRFVLAGAILYAIAGAATAVFGPSAGWALAPMFAGLAALGFSALLGAASFLLSMRSRPGGRKVWRRRFLVAAAPFVVFVGMELLPHVVGPCSISAILDGPRIPTFCERILHGSGFGGKGEVVESIDVKARWHALSHTVFGWIPMTALYALALKRWSPSKPAIDATRPPSKSTPTTERQ